MSPLSGAATSLGIPNFGPADRPALDLSPGLLDITAKINDLLATRSVQIGDSVVPAGPGVSTIDFLSIPATYKHLRLRVVPRGDAVATSIALYLRFNNDVAGDYFWQYIIGNNAVASIAAGVADTRARCGELPAASAPASLYGVNTIEILDYASTDKFKAFIASQQARYTTTGAGMDTGVVGGDWASTAAINRITLLPSSGNFVAGTRATLEALP